MATRYLQEPVTMASEIRILQLLLVGISCIQHAQGYPSGAPPAQCVDGFPFHGVAPLTTPPPFKVILEKDSYYAGDRIQIAIQATKIPQIKGFAVHVRPIDGDGRAVGKFVSFDKDHVQGYSVHAYNEIDVNCLTHRSATNKQRLVFQYLAPAPSLGDLEVLTTFVADKARIWSRVRKVIAANEATTTAFPPIVISKTMEVPKFEQCGTGRGCFLYPRDCSGLDCRYAVTYRISSSGTQMYFEAMASAPDYFTIGFSGDDKMGTDETVTCVYTADHKTVQHGFNMGRCNDRQPLSELSDIAVTRSGDKIFCKWTRPLQVVLRSYFNATCRNGEKYDKGRFRYEFDLRSISYHLFVARGTVFTGSDVIQKHDQLPVISESKINFISLKSQYGWQLPIFVKCHGVLAITAWLGLLAISMTTSRHFKSSLNKLNCGQPIWLQIHIAFNLIGILLSGGCIALMMFHLKDLNYLKLELYYLIHGATGLGATALGVLQIFLGCCRPDQTHRSRGCWTGTHRAFGILSILAACVSIMMGANMEALEFWLRSRLTIIFAVYIGYILIWNIVLAVIGCCISPSKTKSDNIEESAPKPENANRAVYAYYVIYVILLIGSTVLLGLSLAYIGMA